MLTYIFFFFSTSITLIYKIPQMVMLYKTKRTDGISIVSYIIESIGYLLYLLHGCFIKDNPIFYMGLVSLFQSIILILLYNRYKNNKEDLEKKEEIII